MKRSLPVSLLLLFLLVATTGADANPPPGCNCDRGFYEKVVTTYKPVEKEEIVVTFVPRTCYRDEIRQYKTTVMVPKEFIEPCTKFKTISVPREVWQDVTKCQKVPYKAVDPHTGCSTTVYKDVCHCEKVKSIVMDQKVVPYVVDVIVVRSVPVEKIEEKTIKVPETRMEKVLQTRRYVVLVPVQSTVQIPCPPAGSPNYKEFYPVPTQPSPHTPSHGH